MNKVLEENKKTHNIFDGMNEDEFTKKSRKAIRENLYNMGMEDPEEELRTESKEDELEM